MVENMFTWTEDLSVGVEELDEQHRNLFDIINRILTAVEPASSKTKEDKLMLLNELMNYNFYHLGIEEEYMAKFECESRTHADAHVWYKTKSRELFQKSSKLLNDNSEESEHVIKELAKFAGEWHVGHIMNMDKTYTLCFNEHGLH